MQIFLKQKKKNPRKENEKVMVKEIDAVCSKMQMHHLKAIM